MAMLCRGIQSTATRWVLAGLLVAVSLLGARLSAQSSFEGPRRWLTDYAQARAESQRLGLPMVVHFSTTWCGPCIQMERETFSSTQMTQLLGAKFVGLKIDAEEEAELAAGFGVNSYPTDVIVAPNGQIVWRHVGYLGRGAYVGQLKHWENRFEADRATAIAALKPKPPVGTQLTQPGVSSMPVIKQPQPLSNNVPNNVIVQKPNPALVTPSEPTVMIGLDGYSPVRIKNNREWIKGRTDLSVTYQGVVYYLADENERRLFDSNPERYTPRLLGCDPVELQASDRAIPGRIEIGAFYDGELFLFSSIESRNQFKLAPERFTKTRHVLHADDIGRQRFQ